MSSVVICKRVMGTSQIPPQNNQIGTLCQREREREGQAGGRKGEISSGIQQGLTNINHSFVFSPHKLFIALESSGETGMVAWFMSK